VTTNYGSLITDINYPSPYRYPYNEDDYSGEKFTSGYTEKPKDRRCPDSD
jgi:hypothetical protein